MTATGSPEAPAARAGLYQLGPAEQIPAGEGRVFRVAGLSIAVFRTRAGQVYATQAGCPHRGGPLADGFLGAGKVVCPLHGYRFDLTSGAPLGNECPRLQVYAVEVAQTGDLLLRLCAPSTGPQP